LSIPPRTGKPHLTAFHLDPKNVKVTYNPGDQQKILDFLKLHIPEDRVNLAIQQYLNFKASINDFLNEELWCDDAINDPKKYWSLASAYAPELANFAF
jgi:hypothetical protein